MEQKINIPIVFAFDEKMEIPAGVCITSLLESAEENTFYDIFILHPGRCDFSNSSILHLPEKYHNCRITFRSVGNQFASAFEIREITTATYYKLLIPDLIPEYDQVLYSDVDVIFREDQGKYLQGDMGQALFAAVDSYGVLPEDDRAYVAGRLKLSGQDGFFYAGNLVINAKRLREEKKTSEFLQMAAQNRFRFQDMDILNLSCKGRILSLSPAFCLTCDLYDAMVVNRGGIDVSPEEKHHALAYGTVHYNGPKPWKENCLNMDLWWAVYRKSIFFEEKFAHSFWSDRRFSLEKLSLFKRIKLVARYFRKGGKI